MYNVKDSGKYKYVKAVQMFRWTIERNSDHTPSWVPVPVPVTLIFVPEETMSALGEYDGYRGDVINDTIIRGWRNAATDSRMKNGDRMDPELRNLVTGFEESGPVHFIQFDEGGDVSIDDLLDEIKANRRDEEGFRIIKIDGEQGWGYAEKCARHAVGKVTRLTERHRCHERRCPEADSVITGLRIDKDMID